MRAGMLLLDGVWVAASDGATFPVLNPATEQVIGSAASATAADIDAAAAAAARAWTSWRDHDPWDRTAILRRAAELIGERSEEIATTITLEQGKPLAEARAEVTGAREIIDWCADEARRVYGRVVPARKPSTRILIFRKSVGPVAAFTASNFPALLAARKLGAALASGCTVVLKPAEDTPFTALALAQALLDAGLPPGVLNVVTGDPAAIAERLIASTHIRKVSLTGSVPVGRTILSLASDRLLPSSMELGGHAACIIAADADLEAAADAIVRGKWRNGGQVCIAMSRLLVHESVAEPLIELVVARMRLLALGAGMEPGVDVGPLVSERTRGRAEDLLQDAVAHGSHVRAGGHRPDKHPAGYFFEPTLISEVADDARIWREEPFGPVLPVRTFETMDEAVSIANDVGYGLAGYVFTRDLATAMTVSDHLEVGMVGVNNLVIATAEAPAGGVKDSGFGREGGAEALDGYTTTTYVNLALT